MLDSKRISLWVEHKVRWQQCLHTVDFKDLKDPFQEDNNIPYSKWISPFYGEPT